MDVFKTYQVICTSGEAMNKKDKKINEELMEKYSKLLDDLAYDD